MTATMELPHGHLACALCGTAVPSEGAPVVSAPVTDLFGHDYAVRLTRCLTCQPVHEHLEGASPRLRQAAVAILAAGRTLPPRGSESERLAARMLGHWDLLSWDSFFVTTGDVRPRLPLPLAELATSCASEPWGHLGSARRGLVAKEVSRWRFAARHPDATLAVAPPDGERACLCCGIGLISIPVECANDPSPWKQSITTSRSSLGGCGPVSDKVSGWLCPACENAFAKSNHAVGQPLVERAFFAWLTGREPLLGEDIPQFRRLAGWASRTREPNAEPWAHIGSREEIRAALDPPVEPSKSIESLAEELAELKKQLA